MLADAFSDGSACEAWQLRPQQPRCPVSGCGHLLSLWAQRLLEPTRLLLISTDDGTQHRCSEQPPRYDRWWQVGAAQEVGKKMVHVAR